MVLMQTFSAQSCSVVRCGSLSVTLCVGVPRTTLGLVISWRPPGPSTESHSQWKDVPCGLSVSHAGTLVTGSWLCWARFSDRDEPVWPLTSVPFTRGLVLGKLGQSATHCVAFGNRRRLSNRLGAGSARSGAAWWGWLSPLPVAAVFSLSLHVYSLCMSVAGSKHPPCKDCSQYWIRAHPK